VDGGLPHNHRGIIYSISTTGAQKVIYRFKGGSDGSFPQSGLVAVNGTLYGMTTEGGNAGCAPYGCGTVYSVTTSGAEKVLYAFKGGKDGAYPADDLIDVNGALYGTTFEGGGSVCHRNTSSDFPGCGAVFSVTTNGREAILHSFTGVAGDGASPWAGLTDVKGLLYGTTVDGGYNSGGTVFSITLHGSEKILYSFEGGTDGENPVSKVTDVHGLLYGTTNLGGDKGCITSYGTSYEGCGTVYSLSIRGAEKIMHRFAGGRDGAQPQAGLLNVNGALYGTTTVGGVGNGGTIYRLTTSGTETVLYSFAGGAYGRDSTADLTELNGSLYGTTQAGGSPHCRSGCGLVFALTP
jgi:uncharacterized repeat protein (TIGR03803 family)